MHLVTGDNEDVAKTLMDVFPFDDCRANLLPEEKAAWVDKLKREKNNTVVMVGDGVNDALALAHADIGIAMGAAGAEVAMEAADIALADSNLEGLMKVRNLSHQTMRVIDQNHYLAVSTDLIGAALAMAGILSPVMAGMIHILHTGGILFNSGRLLSWQPPVEPMDHCRGCVRACKCGNGRCKNKNKTC
jgi:cation-transporting P-type ATPase C